MVREYMPTLYEASESAFTSNGYGFLADGISCEVTEEIGNSFELEMQYPVTGVYYDLLQIGNIICCRTNTHKTTKQPFRIYRITKPIDGIVTIYAQHISYDLAGYTVDEVNTTYAKDNNATVDTFITFIQSCINKYCSNIGGLSFTLATSGTFDTAAWSVTSFTDIRTMMRQAAQLFNGQWEYNGTTCTLYRRRGADRGVTIEYGKNLTGIREDADISSTYTHVMPYYKGTEGEGEQKHDIVVGGLSAAVATGAQIGYNRTKGLDLSSEYNTTPTVEQLQERAQKYIAVSEIGKIVISRDVEAVDRGKTVEYPQLDGEDIIEIGDTIGIVVPVLGISASMDCMRLTYDAYLDYVKSYEIGDIKENFVSMVAADDKEVKNKIDDIDDWIDDADDRLDDIEEALNERAPTLYVQEDEPEGTEQDPLVSGDEWLQIDEEKNAMAYYKYSSSWSLQCYFGGRFDPIIQNEQPIDTTSETETYDLWVNVKGTIADTDTLANINIANVRGLWEKGSGWTKKAYVFGKTEIPVATVDTQEGDYWFKVDSDGLISQLWICTFIALVGPSITATWAQVFPTDQTGHSVDIYLENREPVKQGDYWLKIQNDQSKLAQQLGRWSGSQWDLVLKFTNNVPNLFWSDSDPASNQANDVQTGDYWIVVDSSASKYIQSVKMRVLNAWVLMGTAGGGGNGLTVNISHAILIQKA